MSNLSRRSIVASATALPALAVPAAAIPALANVDDDKLVTLAAAVEMASDDKLPAALNLQQIAEMKMWEWKKKNPHPRLLDHQTGLVERRLCLGRCETVRMIQSVRKPDLMLNLFAAQRRRCRQRRHLVEGAGKLGDRFDQRETLH